MAGAPSPFGLGRTPFASGVLDVAAEARDVLHQMAGEAAGHLVQLEFAVQPDLLVHADRLALRAVLSELVGNAMRHAPGGRVLLSAIRLGGRVQIAVIDDGDGPAAAVQEAALREMAQLVALQGGTIDVETHSGEGTTVVVRLPEPTGTGRVPGEAPKRPSAERPTAPPRVAREAVVEHSWDI
ncbi:MAG: HAMP domain-containing sensor histidine kinase [Acetobacteraceae bacterium]